MKTYRVTTDQDHEAKLMASDLRDRFEAEGGRISVGLDGHSFWVMGPSDGLLPEATVEVRPHEVDVCLLNESAYGAVIAGWARQSGARAAKGNPRPSAGM
jgi:hypothetical protein